MSTLVVLSGDDDVAVCVEGAAAGSSLALPSGEVVIAVDDIPSGHKIAIRPVAAGSPVRKYGQHIGSASKTIEVGEHVHTHNVVSARAQVRR